MKKQGVLNAHLSKIIASMGHTDKLVICDSGFPIPRHHEAVDLALVANVPHFTEALKAVLGELKIEEAIIAEELEQRNHSVYRQVSALLRGAPVRRVPHEEFKKLAAAEENTAFVRTGEATPYANVILVSGVTFD